MLLICGLPALALDNSVTVHNNYTGAMTNHPIWFGRWFAQGEVPDYCKPFATPSNTGVRAAVSEWQCSVQNRWRDGTAVRNITGVRTGSPAWSNAAGLTNIVVASDIATMTTAQPHGLTVSDRLMITGTPTDADLVKDNFVVRAVPSPTTAQFLTRSVSNGIYMTNFTVTQAIDPVNPSGLRYFSANHGFYKGEEVVIAGVGAVLGANGTFKITAVTRNEFVVNAQGAGSYGGGGTASGPANGSLRFALVALKATIPSGGSTRIDFVNDANPSSSGDEAATRDAAYDKAEMLAANWGAQLVATANVQSGSTSAITTDARTMLAAWSGTESSCGPRYWAAGPVLTWFILDYACQSALTYDFAWRIVAGPILTQPITSTTQDTFTVESTSGLEVGTRLWMYISSAQAEVMTILEIIDGTTLRVTRSSMPGSTSTTYASGLEFGTLQWVDAPNANYKSLHPLWQLRFVPGWSGVGERIEVRNEYFTKMQSLWYAVDFKTGATPATRFHIDEFKHANRTSWKLDTWDGDNPEFYCQGGAGADPDNCAGTGGGTRARKYRIDHNTPYLIYAKALPQYQLFPGESTSEWNVSTGYPGSGFAFSDKGTVGVARNFGPASAYPGKYLGDGTWGVDALGSKEAVFSMNADQEGGILEAVQALWIQTWDLPGYEINFGDSVPGGGGNVEAQAHIPMHNRDSDSVHDRFVMPGFSDSAFGQEISLYARTSWRSAEASYANSAVQSLDRPNSACGAGSAPLTMTSANIRWPCYHSLVIHGADGWTIHGGHLNDWNWLSYLITADPRYVDLMNTFTAWSVGWHSSRNGTQYKSWGTTTTGSPASLFREQSWTTRAVMRSALMTPNVPQFGASGAGVWSYYYDEKLWDQIYGAEGFMQITDGYFARHYPGQFPYSCSGYFLTDPSLWKYGRCSLALDQPNPLGWPTFTFGAFLPAYSYVAAGRGLGLWMIGYSTVQMAWWEQLGGEHYRYVRKKLAGLQLNIALNAVANPFLAVAAYQNPAPSATEFFQTMSAYWNGYAVSWVSGITHYRTDPTFAYVSGTDGTLNSGFVSQAQGWSSFGGVTGGNIPGCTPIDRPPAGCTNTAVHSWMARNRPGQTLSFYNPKYAFIPRQSIEELTIIPGGNSAVATYTAPTGDACYFYVGGTAPSSTLDATDVSDGGGEVSRQVVLTGLSPATDYHFRLTCGSRVSGLVSGTGRTASSFTTVNEGPGITLSVGLGSLAGAASATVEYGDSPALGSAIGPEACVSGCTVSVPATSRKLLYYRITYTTAEAATLARGPVQQVIPE